MPWGWSASPYHFLPRDRQMQNCTPIHSLNVTVNGGGNVLYSGNASDVKSRMAMWPIIQEIKRPLYGAAFIPVY